MAGNDRTPPVPLTLSAVAATAGAALCFAAGAVLLRLAGIETGRDLLLPLAVGAVLGLFLEKRRTRHSTGGFP